jgi:hypothetical protein
MSNGLEFTHVNGIARRVRDALAVNNDEQVLPHIAVVVTRETWDNVATEPTIHQYLDQLGRVHLHGVRIIRENQR